jgi:hypothetical protein
MSNNFTKAIQFTLPWEVGKEKDGSLRKDGGINYHDGDLTKWGLFRKYHPWLTEDTPLAKAWEVYKTEYYDWYKFRRDPVDLDSRDCALAVTTFDTGVNCGTGRAYLWLLAALKEKDPTKHLLGLREQHYVKLKNAGNPMHVRSYNGWMNRHNDLKKYVDILKAEERQSTPPPLVPYADRKDV